MPAARRKPADDGYGLVLAVVATAAFAYIALQALAANRGDIDLMAARMEQARLAAAADAGVNLAIRALADPDPTTRWSIDGRVRHVDFDGADLAIAVEDERGKAPLSGLDNNQARVLFAGGGATGERLDALVAEYRQWQNEDVSDPAAADAQAAPAAPIRHGPFRTVGELAGLADMDGALYDRIAPALTVFFANSGPFEPRHARPLAIAVMAAESNESGDQVANEDQFAGEHPSEEIADDGDLLGRTLTVRVTALAADGARTHRTAIVELTGDDAKPYWIRYVE